MFHNFLLEPCFANRRRHEAPSDCIQISTFFADEDNYEIHAK